MQLRSSLIVPAQRQRLVLLKVMNEEFRYLTKKSIPKNISHVQSQSVPKDDDVFPVGDNHLRDSSIWLRPSQLRIIILHLRLVSLTQRRRPADSLSLGSPLPAPGDRQTTVMRPSSFCMWLSAMLSKALMIWTGTLFSNKQYMRQRSARGTPLCVFISTIQESLLASRLIYARAGHERIY